MCLTGAIGGVDVSLLEVLDDNNSDTWSVDVAASEFELNEEQRLDEFLDESTTTNDDSGLKYHSRRGSRRSKKSSLGFVSSTSFDPSATLSYDDFVANQIASDSGFGALNYEGMSTLLFCPISVAVFDIASLKASRFACCFRK